MNHPKATSAVVASILFASAIAYAQPAAPAAAPPSAPPEAPPPPPQPPAEPPKAAPPAPQPVTSRFKAQFYGYIELNIFYDTAQGWGEGVGNARLPRPGTVAYSNPQLQIIAKDSRFGWRFSAPDWEGLKTSGQIEADFFGNNPPGIGEAAPIIAGTLRIRHANLRLETEYISILAGQWWDLFGWGGGPYLPRTLAFHGLPGEVFHRNPQLRFYRRFKGDPVDFELAAAVVRQVQVSSGKPDLQAGARVFLNDWKGVHSMGAGPLGTNPLSVGVSGVYRQLRLAPFPVMGVTGDFVKKPSWGMSAQAFIPVIKGTLDDPGNTVSLTAEYNLGSGIADYYSGLTMTSFPTPVPAMGMPATPYASNIDNGIVAYNATTNEFIPIKWSGLTTGIQYNLPGGKIWVSGVYSQMKSSNIDQVGAPPATVYNKSRYFDLSAFFTVGPAAQINFMYQNGQQTYVDGVKSAMNHRGTLAIFYFF